MEMLDRYLHSVEFWLPKAQRKDIIAELSEDLRSEIDENEAKLGRKLNEDELVAILRKRGNPVLVASRYSPSRPLIGPALAPLYWFVMKLVLLWVLVPTYVLVVAPILVLKSSHPVIALIDALWTFLTSAAISAGIITLVFAVLDRRSVQDPRFTQWDPRRLPRVRAAKRYDQPTPRYVAISEMVMALIVSLLFVMLFQTSFELNGVRFSLAPIFRMLYWPTLLVMISGIPVGAVSLLRPSAVRLRSAIRLAANLTTLALVGILLSWGSWVEIAAPMFRAADVAEAEKWTNFGVWLTLLVIAIVVTCESIADIRRLIGPVGQSSGLSGPAGGLSYDPRK